MDTLAVPVTDLDHVQGSPDAAVTLVEYGDFECSHCGQAFAIVREVQRQLDARLRFVFRAFPLTRIHRHALHAAEAAEAAAAQGRFWEMHTVLFEHQNALGDHHLVEHAEAIGLDAARVARELEAQTHVDRLREVFDDGVRSGVHGTPTFFINGVRHEDAWDAGTLLRALRTAR